MTKVLSTKLVQVNETIYESEGEDGVKHTFAQYWALDGQLLFELELRRPDEVSE